MLTHTQEASTLLAGRYQRQALHRLEQHQAIARKLEDDRDGEYSDNVLRRRILLLNLASTRHLIALVTPEEAEEEFDRLAAAIVDGTNMLRYVSDEMALEMAACGFAAWM